MEKILDLRGKWQLKGEGLSHCEVYLPGTLDTNQVGHKDTPELATRFTRLHTWEGSAWYSREIGLPSAEGGRLLLKVERTRKLALFIDGKEIEVFEQGSLSTPYMFEITDFAGQLVKMEFSVDNKYTGWPVDSILSSSAATDETQTNWNGILGDFSIYRTGKTFLSSLRIYPMKDSVLVRGEVSSTEKIGKNWTLRLCSEAFLGKVVMFSLGGMKFEQEIPLKASCRKWDEEEGNVYTVHAQLLAGEQLLDQRKETFGIRIFGVDEGLRLTLNGRRFFLRGRGELLCISGRRSSTHDRSRMGKSPQNLCFLWRKLHAFSFLVSAGSGFSGSRSAGNDDTAGAFPLELQGCFPGRGSEKLLSDGTAGHFAAVCQPSVFCHADLWE